MKEMKIEAVMESEEGKMALTGNLLVSGGSNAEQMKCAGAANVLSTAEIRRIFLDFFAQHGHKVVASSPLVPVGDDTLFFTNAGMVQFKSTFLGAEQRDYRRATTVQRCLRASGKHNDLENVGYTTRHHTFFEMLGNFSFGDYFKSDAIHFAWTLLTERLQLPPERLWVTVHHDDHEAEQLWRAEFERSGRHAQGISHCGDHDNFWSMGDTGPCGYCSEIFYDHGEQFAGDPPGGAVEGERYIEIWNLVFMQFERDSAGQRRPLPKPSIDTGIGLERLAAVLQGVHDNYDIDLFKTLLAELEAVLRAEQSLRLEQVDAELKRIASRVVVDHIRSTVLLMADGVLPSNDKHGYVLRSIMRRALFYLYRLGVRAPLFYRMVPAVVRVMGDAYPELELANQQARIMQAVLEEEEKFLITIGRGIELLEQELPKCKDGCLSGAVAFKMHDTYGLPLALSSELAKQVGLQVDKAGFDAELEKQRSASRKDMKNNLKTAIGDSGWLHGVPATRYCELGGDADGAADAAVIGQVLKLGKSGLDAPDCCQHRADQTDGREQNCASSVVTVQAAERLSAQENGIAILDCSGFYAESGGAVGDCGYLETTDGSTCFRVDDVKKYGDIYLHYGQLERGELVGGIMLVSRPDLARQLKIRANHSATHLLQAALRTLLGPQVVQRGSLVNDQLLRFDFAYNQALTGEQLAELERLVNQMIIADLPVAIEHMSLADAKKSGAMALFGERYGDEVRVVCMGDRSKELCGGLHVTRTGVIGSLKIEQENGVAAGVRRIVAVTRMAALGGWQRQRQQCAELAALLGVEVGELNEQVERLLGQLQAQRQQIAGYRHQALQVMAAKLWQQRREMEIDAAGLGAPDQQRVAAQLVMADQLLGTELEPGQLKQLWDGFKQHANALVFLRLLATDRQYWLVGIGSDLVKLGLNAGDLMKRLMHELQGKGGGKRDLAQGSAAYAGAGSDPWQCQAANGDNDYDGVIGWLSQKILNAN